MLKNYLKIALRNLLKRKGYSLLNIVGLAIGMTCCLLILQYVNYERSFDDFHKDGDRVVRLRIDEYQEGQRLWQSATVYPAFGPTMKRDFPEIEDFCRLHDAEMLVTNPTKNIKFTEKKGYFADPSFTKIFTLPFVEGNPETALDAPDKIILSESHAKKYFGNENAVGKTLIITGSSPKPELYEVTGIFKDYPKNSHLKIDYLVSYSTLGKIQKMQGDTTNSTETNWGWYDFYTYFKLRPGATMAQVQAKLPAFCNQYINAKNAKYKLSTEAFLMPMKDIHLYANYNQEAEVNGNGETVSYLFIIAFFILTIAWTNYINLATARSFERAKEVGVRKVMGALREQLVGQFMMESLLLNLSALALAFLSAYMAMPFFSNLLEQEILFTFSNKPAFWLLMAGVFLFGTLLSGIYPAFVMSGIKLISVLKGVLPRVSGGISMRRALIVSQFGASIALIVGTIVVYQQINYMRNQKLGVNIEQTLVLEGSSSNRDSTFHHVFNPFKNDLMHMKNIQSVATSSNIPGDEIYWTQGAKWLHSNADTRTTMYLMAFDYDFMPSYNVQLVAGRAFSEQFGEDKKSVILNESGMKALGFENAEKAINEQVKLGRDTLKVIGIATDFHQESLKRAVNPMIFFLDVSRIGTGSNNFYSIKLKTDDMSQSLAEIQQTWAKYFPNDPFNYFFLNEHFDHQYKSDILFGKVFGFFAMLAILVACLGLLGLSSYNVLQRTKEIGIRKVLGASTPSLVVLLSQDFLKLVCIAMVIASPIAWYAMSKWLNDFAYRIEIRWWFFAIAGILAVMIALLTVSYQAVKAALMNPVKSLKTE